MKSRCLILDAGSLLMQAVALKHPTQRERRQTRVMEASLHRVIRPGVIRQQVEERNSKCTLPTLTPGSAEQSMKNFVGTATMLQHALHVATPSGGFLATQDE